MSKESFITKLTNALATRAATVVAILLMSAATSFAGNQLYIVVTMATEVRAAQFNSELTRLEKQVDKISRDPGDIKAADMKASVNFCGSGLFDDYIKAEDASDRKLIARSCDSVEDWITNQSKT